MPHLIGHARCACEILRRVITPMLGTVAIDSTHLPRSQSQAQKLCAVGGVRVKRESLHRSLLGGINICFALALTLACVLFGGAFGALAGRLFPAILLSP